MNEHKTVEGNAFEILKFIHEFKETHDYSPSNREITMAIRTKFGYPLSLSVLHYHLDKLRTRWGYINFIPRQSRTVHLTSEGKAFVRAHLLPERIAAMKVASRK